MLLALAQLGDALAGDRLGLAVRLGERVVQSQSFAEKLEFKASNFAVYLFLLFKIDILPLAV